MFRKMMILGLFSTLFGCGDGKPGLFSANGYHIGKEKVWYKTSTGMAYSVTEVAGADPGTFAEHELKSRWLEGASAFFGMDKNGVFWAGSKIAGADRASFEYVCSNYSRDNHAVYYMTQPLTDDLAHFSVVNNDFVKDSRAVYFGGEVFSDDPGFFAAVGEEHSGYYKDRKKCWYGIYELRGADPATLYYIGPRTAADTHHVYHEMNEVEGADQKTYRILAHEYARDVRNVYQKGVRMVGADPASFQVLADHYSKDKRYCYYFMTRLPDADPATFELIDEFYARDARQVFSLDKPIEGADPATFRVLNGPAGCSCDARRAYAMEKPIAGVDPRNFPAGKPCVSCNESEVKF